jgi:hypothetical protein
MKGSNIDGDNTGLIGPEFLNTEGPPVFLVGVILVPSFEKFRDGWVKEYLKLRNEGANSRQIGHAFERHFLIEALRPFIPEGYIPLRDERTDGVKIRGTSVDYKFDLLVVKRNAVNLRGVAASNVLAAFELKSRGFFGDQRQEIVKNALEVEKTFPDISFFYVTFREREDYDAEVRRIFGNIGKRYYRLAESGDGSMPPPKYFQEEWKRLIEDLSVLKH